MKKLLFTLFLFALCAVFATSCNKTCRCTQWVGGEEKDKFTIELPREEKISCAEKSNDVTVDGVRVGVSCK